MAAVQGKFDGTASLLHNNLACSPAGWLACARNSVFTGGAGKAMRGKLMLHNSGSCGTKAGPEGDQIMSLRYLELPFGSVLCVSSTTGTMIYNEDAEILLFYAKITESGADSDSLKYHQGACAVPPLQQVVVGTYKGSLLMIHAPAPEQLAQLGEAAPSSATTEVADVCFVAATNSVASAHNNGEIRIWSVDSSPYSNTMVIPATTYQAPVRIASLGARLMVAYGPGIVCLHDATSGALQVELTAHARWMTAVAVREDLGRIATVGEDTALNVWDVEPAQGLVSLVHSCIVTDKLLTGVAFLGPGCAVTAYDSDEFFLVSY